MRKAGGDEMIETGPIKMPKEANLSHRQDSNMSDSPGLVQMNFSKEISSNELEKVERNVALRSFFSGDLQELDEKCNSMMEKTSKRKENGHLLYRCQVCGKEAINGDLKSHIESNHLDGFSIPCNLCEKTFRSRKSLGKHNSCHY